LNSTQSDFQYPSNFVKKSVGFGRIRNPSHPQLLLIQLIQGIYTVFAMNPMGSGYWYVRRARSAVNEQSPAVNRIKNGSSFFGYTDNSWNAAHTTT